MNVIDIPPPTEPEIMTVLAIYFSLHEGQSKDSFFGVSKLFNAPFIAHPNFVTISCQPSNSSGKCPIPVLDSLFDGHQVKFAIITTGLNGEHLRFPFQFWYAPRLLHEGSPENLGISHITFGASKKAWSSPIIVLKFSGTRKGGYLDAGSNDFPALSGYFLSQ